MYDISYHSILTMTYEEVNAYQQLAYQYLIITISFLFSMYILFRIDPFGGHFIIVLNLKIYLICVEEYALNSNVRLTLFYFIPGVSIIFLLAFDTCFNTLTPK